MDCWKLSSSKDLMEILKIGNPLVGNNAGFANPWVGSRLGFASRLVEIRLVPLWQNIIIQDLESTWLEKSAAFKTAQIEEQTVRVRKSAG